MKDRSAEALAVAALASSETLAGDRRYAIGDTISPAAGGD
jgi:hypothetical protein